MRHLGVWTAVIVARPAATTRKSERTQPSGIGVMSRSGTGRRTRVSELTACPHGSAAEPASSSRIRTPTDSSRVSPLLAMVRVTRLPRSEGVELEDAEGDIVATAEECPATVPSATPHPETASAPARSRSVPSGRPGDPSPTAALYLFSPRFAPSAVAEHEWWLRADIWRIAAAPTSWSAAGRGTQAARPGHRSQVPSSGGNLGEGLGAVHQAASPAVRGLVRSC